ncbi:hypothetical protein SALBM135S_09479 [Streptomyces alboniger]
MGTTSRPAASGALIVAQTVVSVGPYAFTIRRPTAPGPGRLRRARLAGHHQHLQGVRQPVLHRQDARRHRRMGGPRPVERLGETLRSMRRARSSSASRSRSASASASARPVRSASRHGRTAGLPHIGMRGKDRLHLTRLHPEPTDLHLLIRTAPEEQLGLRQFHPARSPVRYIRPPARTDTPRTAQPSDPAAPHAPAPPQAPPHTTHPSHPAEAAAGNRPGRRSVRCSAGARSAAVRPAGAAPPGPARPSP